VLDLALGIDAVGKELGETDARGVALLRPFLLWFLLLLFLFCITC
jgi:hypothetical protein